MAFDNGSGQGGGNGSVWFEVRHGSDSKPQTLEAFDGAAIGVPPSSAATRKSTKGAPAPASSPKKRSAAAARPNAGQVKLANDGKCACVSIHDKTNLDDLGADDHKGMFRVRLRVHKATMERLIANEKDPRRQRELKRYWALLPLVAAKLQKLTGPAPRGRNEAWEDTEGDVFLVIDVPAIPRKAPKGQKWSSMPWELYWQW
jgi:hypothetical protein